MGFKSVYRTLQELFPQVDARLLKAAAIEHSKDPDAAVEFILTDVIPNTTRKFDACRFVNGSLGSSVQCERQCSSTCSSSSKHESTAASKAANGSEEMKVLHHLESPFLNMRTQYPLVSTLSDEKDLNNQLRCYPGSKEITTAKTREETNNGTARHVSAQDISVFSLIGDLDLGDCNQLPENNSFGGTSTVQKSLDSNLPAAALSASSTSAVHQNNLSEVGLNNTLSDIFSPDCDPRDNSNVTVHTESQNKQLNFDCESSYGSNDSNYVELALLSAKDHTLESLNCSIQSHVGSLMSDSKLETSEVIGDSICREDIHVLDKASTEESASPHNTLALSVQVCDTDLLENVIEDSKSHKTKLLSDMESVLKLMKEVEFQENAAEQAKKEAVNGDLEICFKVEELESMLKRAREANDMHSGEVYGERSILATEMKELQSRLFALSALKEESLSILDAMRQPLEARLAAALTERVEAEQEIHVREESARIALAQQELNMEKVVQESKILQQEAEENARLREFLMDRGHVVDMLQGEISVICKDVKLLKEKFDNRIPLSQSISSEQTSCILAHSGSAWKSTGPCEQLLKHEKPSTLYVEPLLTTSGKKTTALIEELSDDGWELFEDAAQN